MSPSPKIDLKQEESGWEGASHTPPKEARDATREGPRGATGVRVDCFPTPIWRFSVAGHQALNDKLMQFIQNDRRRNPAGQSGRSTVMGWHSADQLHHRPELQEFIAVVHDNVAEVARSYRIDTNQANLELATCWAIVNDKMASGAIHCHPNSFLSGVYYVNTTDETGNIFFQDPRPAANMLACPVTEYTPWTIRQVTYQPAPGGMLIFPSWLYHGVGPNLSETPRVSLSFNFRLKWTATS
jgi:uncharacterized protein (TIGR02466 family)